MSRLIPCLIMLFVVGLFYHSGLALRAADPPKKEIPKPLPNELVEIEREAASDRRSSTVPTAVVTAHCLLLREIIRNSVANLYFIKRFVLRIWN